MEDYQKRRPKKRVFSLNLQKSLRNKAVKRIKSVLLPDDKIIKIVLIGSSVKNNFGEYEPPGVRGSLYSDYDFIVFVEEDYLIPSWLDKEPGGKPFPDNKLNLAYRSKRFIENKYDAEIFFVRRSTMENSKIQKLAEMPGCEIPFSDNSKWKYIIVYMRDSH